MNKNISILLASIFLVFASCDKGFEDLNKDPNNSTTVEAHLLLANATKSISDINYSTGISGDQGACWSQQWAKVQYNDEARYASRAATSNTVWLLYTSIQELKDAEKLALEVGDNATAAAAITLQAYCFQLVTDIFGDVPFSEANAGTSGIFTPKYDTQQDVYSGVINLYDRAIQLFSKGTGTIEADSDRIFSGDTNKWLKFASSLKFRALMRISNATGVTNSNLQNIGDQLSALMPNLMTSNDDSAFYNYFGADPNGNPIFQTIVQSTRAEYRISSVMVDFLNSKVDPRLAVYAQEAPDGASGFRGSAPGTADLPNNDYNYNNTSPIGSLYLDVDAPAFFISNSEVSFLKAEAAQRGLIAGDASAFYNDGITASFAENELADVSVNFVNANPLTSATALKQIGEQKWVALFGQGFEAWTEWRRTGYPELTVIPDPINTTSIPVRFTYPVQEQAVNQSNYDAAISVFGADELTTKVWWNK